MTGSDGGDAVAVNVARKYARPMFPKDSQLPDVTVPFIEYAGPSEKQRRFRHVNDSSQSNA